MSNSKATHQSDERKARAVRLHHLAEEFRGTALESGEPVDIVVHEILSAAALLLSRGAKGRPGTSALALEARKTLAGADQGILFELAVSRGRVSTPKQALSASSVLRWCCECAVKDLKGVALAPLADRSLRLDYNAGWLARMANESVPGIGRVVGTGLASDGTPKAAKARLLKALREKTPADVNALMRQVLHAFEQSGVWINRRMVGERKASSRAKVAKPKGGA